MANWMNKKCPKCNDADCIDVAATVWVRLTEDSKALILHLRFCVSESYRFETCHARATLLEAMSKRLGCNGGDVCDTCISDMRKTRVLFFGALGGLAVRARRLVAAALHGPARKPILFEVPVRLAETRRVDMAKIRKVIVRPAPEPQWANDMRRSRWAAWAKEADYTESLSALVSERYDAGEAFVTNDGLLNIPRGNKQEKQLVSDIRTISFVPSPTGETKADMFAFVRKDRDTKLSKPTYLGTFDINEPPFEATENLLRGLGIGVGKLFKTSPS
jgi:hypothetical protein